MYTFSRKTLVSLAVVFACCAPAAAQMPSQTAPKQPSPAAIALARDVMTAKGVSGVITPLAVGVIEKVKASFLPTNPNLSRELNDVATGLHKELDGRSKDAIDRMAVVYAARFTEQELKDVLAFYKSPVGQKYLTEEPVAIDEALKDAQQWADAFADTVMTRFRSEMQKKGHPL